MAIGVRNAPHLRYHGACETLGVQCHKQKPDFGKEFAGIGLTIVRAKVKRADLAAAGIVLATGQRLVAMAPWPGFSVAFEVVQRAVEPNTGLDTGRAHDLMAVLILKYKQIVLVGGIVCASLKALYRMLDLLCQGVPVWHQGCESRSGLNGNLIKGVKIPECDRADQHGLHPECCLDSVWRLAVPICRFISVDMV